MSEELPKRYFIWGEPDTGKTLFVNRLAQRMKSNVYTKRCGGSWEGYKGEKVVHIEDLVSDNIQYIKTFLKNWVDYYPFKSRAIYNAKTNEDGEKREVLKEGEWIHPNNYVFIITSRKSPEEIFGDLDSYTRDKIYNRITIMHFTKDDVKKVKEFNTVNKDLSPEELFESH